MAVSFRSSAPRGPADALPLQFAADGADRRRVHARAQTHGEALVDFGKGHWRCRCLDLGVGGVAVLGPAPLAKGQPVTLFVRVEGVSVCAVAIVIWSRRIMGGWIWGLRFFAIAPTDAQHIARAVAIAKPDHGWGRLVNHWAVRLFGPRVRVPAWLVGERELDVVPADPNAIDAVPTLGAPLTAIITGETQPLLLDEEAGAAGVEAARARVLAAMSQLSAIGAARPLHDDELPTPMIPGAVACVRPDVADDTPPMARSQRDEPR